MEYFLPNELHEKVIIFYTNWLDMLFIKNDLLDNYCLSTYEEKGAWSNLLLAFALQFPFVCYLRFRLSG